MQYLMIQNPGEAPVEGYTVLGVSTSRGCAGTIGQFGSGAKHAVNLLLRSGIHPIVFCGPLRLFFFSKEKEMDDGLEVRSYKQVYCRISGKTEKGTVNREQDLGFAEEYGSYDWNGLEMALREFVSNALDRTIREEDGFQKALKEDRLAVKVVDENKVRAKAGFTRIFVPYEQDVIKYHADLGKRFLHFSEPELLTQKVLPKGRNLDDSRTAMIYRKGVLVRQIKGDKEESLFDYNFGEELEIDESRNLDEYSVKHAATKALREAEPHQIAKMFTAAIDDKKVWELTFDSYYLSVEHVYGEKKEKVKQNWKDGWKIAAGDGVLCTDSKYFTESVRKKGFKPITIQRAELMNVAMQVGITTATSCLTWDEVEGKEIIDATPAAIEAVDTVWGWLEKARLTQDLPKPPVFCFRSIMDKESEVMGFVRPGGKEVYLNESISSGGVSKYLLQTALEEVAHYVTGATDMSRDFQDFLFKMIVEVMA